MIGNHMDARRFACFCNGGIARRNNVGRLSNPYEDHHDRVAWSDGWDLMEEMISFAFKEMNAA